MKREISEPKQGRMILYLGKLPALILFLVCYAWFLFFVIVAMTQLIDSTMNYLKFGVFTYSPISEFVSKPQTDWVVFKSIRDYIWGMPAFIFFFLVSGLGLRLAEFVERAREVLREWRKSK